MAASYAGAKRAIRARAELNWTSTRLAFKNETPDAPWPPVGADNQPAPWLLMEIAGRGGRIFAQGRQGAHLWHYDRLILGHAFVPKGAGDDLATTYAEAFGEIFRTAQFYDDVTLGAYVRCLTPSVDENDDGTADEDGLWYRRTVSIDFTYWHRG